MDSLDSAGQKARELELELKKRLLEKIAHNMYKNSQKRNITNNVLIVRRFLFVVLFIYGLLEPCSFKIYSVLRL